MCIPKHVDHSCAGQADARSAIIRSIGTAGKATCDSPMLCSAPAPDARIQTRTGARDTTVLSGACPHKRSGYAGVL
jgi:hypothetical protein